VGAIIVSYVTAIHVCESSTLEVMASLPRTESDVVKSADRTIDILELLANEPYGLTISDISDRLRVARSSTHGLVHTLRRRGYLVQRPDRRFQLGARLIQLGLNVVDRLELRAIAREFLEKLVATTHDTALLVVPDRGEFLFLDKILSDALDVRTDPRVTSRRPLHCSSLGKALLAALPDEIVVRALDIEHLEAVTRFTITDGDALLQDLARTRERGYALDHQESVLGVFCVGAPVRDHTGRSVAAISLSTIKDFFDPDATGPLVTAAAVDISQAMGWRGDASSLFTPVDGSEQLLFGANPSLTGDAE
jgi:IclR family KDG regulon transcriptional repressor